MSECDHCNDELWVCERHDTETMDHALPSGVRCGSAGMPCPVCNEGLDQLNHHRFRFYPKVWSTFDGIEPCTKPKFCMGCTYKHPRCDERGRTAPDQK